MRTFEWWLAWRHLKAKKDHAYLSLITVISVIGVGLGSAALIIVLSVMNGFSNDLQKKIVASRAHIEVRALDEEGVEDVREEIKKSDRRIVGVTPLVTGDVMFLQGQRKAGGILKGFDPETINDVIDLDKSIFQRLTPEEQEVRESEKIYLGSELAAIIGGRSGTEVTVVSPIETVGPFGAVPKTQVFIVGGLSQTGVYEYDATAGYIPIDVAQKFFNLKDRFTSFSVKVDNINFADDVAASINSISNGRWEAKSWGELNKILISALKLEKFGMFIVLLLAILVATFNILSTLHLMVKEKQREISIMKAMGAEDRQIRKIFWFEGAMIGTAGTMLGLILAILGCWALTRIDIKMPGIYYIEVLPVAPKLLYFFLVAGAALLLSYTATLYPASRAAKVDPLTGIKYVK